MKVHFPEVSFSMQDFLLHQSISDFTEVKNMTTSCTTGTKMCLSVCYKKFCDVMITVINEITPLSLYFSTSAVVCCLLFSILISSESHLFLPKLSVRKLKTFRLFIALFRAYRAICVTIKHHTAACSILCPH